MQTLRDRMEADLSPCTRTPPGEAQPPGVCGLGAGVAGPSDDQCALWPKEDPRLRETHSADTPTESRVVTVALNVGSFPPSPQSSTEAHSPASSPW